ncbi:S9 family peptidase [candidate division KSB1 bacterium]|nr:S9 family peptidase [candidate division KSB1 bacterium]NIR68995.1 S9 family peptidase [candidate division KSB1 bacterium]NIS22617.1 S9 family peptidase [candidate division KSB1 bacterium]NIT69477.1 S9 family peptidase [candidate division KSB1 bacterium]NIU23132.1 S9 family peptidase [candidate division KSB1 bacterium]
MKTRAAYIAFLLFWWISGVAAHPLNDINNRFKPIDVFQLEYASDPQISPDGKKIVYARRFMDIMKDRRRSNLWIINFDGSNHRALTTGNENHTSPRWSPDGSRLLYVSGSKGSAQIYLRWMDTGQTAKLTNLTHPPRGMTWSPDGHWIAFSMLVPDREKPFVKMPPKPKGAEWADPPNVITKLRYRADGRGYLEDGYAHLFVLPAEGGSPRQVTSGEFHHRERPTWAPDSKSLIFSANRHEDWQYDPLNSEIYEVSLADGAIKAITHRQGPDTDPVMSPYGKKIAYLGFDDKYQGYQTTRLYVMNRDGSGREVITADFDRDVRRPFWSADGKGLYFQYDDEGNTKIGFVSLDGAVHTLAKDVGGLSLGRPYAAGSFSVARNGRFAFTHSQPDHPADVAVGSKGNADESRLTYLNKDLFGYKQLGSVEEIWYESSYDDGRQIQGWIVKPPKFDPIKTYPLILEIHGGPFANYGDRFAAEIQLYAAAGYVVFYANPRGSTSYGEEFGNLIHHNYPGQDYDDLMSGVDAVIERGYIDEENLFVTGGSGGGVLSAWIVGKTDRFRAAVVAKPVINWYSFVLTSDAYNFFYKYWFPGFPWDHAEHYLQRSPLHHVGNVTTPTMLLTGEVDYRTPISESEQFYQALKLRKIDTALVRVPDASHGIAARPSNLIAKVLHVLKWFEKYKTTED